MITIINGKQTGEFITGKKYYKDKTALAKIIMPLTKRLRANQAKRFLFSAQSHLDIGCGDGFFIKQSPCKEAYGLDLKYGDNFSDKLDFSDNSLDFITMLAVIEHLDKPKAAIKEIHRTLKPSGRFIFTTPRKKGELLIKLYSPNIASDHKQYFELSTIKTLSEGFFKVIAYHTFFFGINQLFCLEKI